METDENGNPIEDDTQKPDPDDEKKFSQKDFNRMLQQRLARVKSTTETDPSIAEALATAQKAEKAALAREAEATKKATELLAERENLRTEATLEHLAVQNGVKPESIDRFLKVIDRSGIKKLEDGTLTGLEEAVKAAVKEDWAAGFITGRTVRGNPTNPPAGGGAKASENDDMNARIRAMSGR